MRAPGLDDRENAYLDRIPGVTLATVNLGFDAEATDFYDEHVEADAVHENIAAYDLAGGLARQEPRPLAGLGGACLDRGRRGRPPPCRRPRLFSARRGSAPAARGDLDAPSAAPLLRDLEHCLLGQSALGPEPDRLVSSVAEGADARASAAAEGHHTPLDLDLVAVLVEDHERAADEIRPVPVRRDRHR
jgi:hypothetical protein